MVAVIPAPIRMKHRDGAPFTIDATTTVSAPAELSALADWFVTQLDMLTGIRLKTSGEEMERTIRLELVDDDPELDSLPNTSGVRADRGDVSIERHSIEIGDRGVRVRAGAPEGIFRGLTTLLQLAATGERVGDRIPLPPLSIRDAPRFAWRGLSLDVVRRAATVDEVEQVIDLLALYKANVLHLHLTDAEGWRIEIESWPRLTEVGGGTAANGRPGGFFTKTDYARIVRYAADRFITVVPEVEMPGHIAAAFGAYPELAGDGVEPGTTNLDRSPWFQHLHPDNPSTARFLSDVLGEVAELTPGAFLHVGGDEALGMDPELYARMVNIAREIVRGLGKEAVGWQETARAGLNSGSLIQSWLSPTEEDIDRMKSADPPEGVELPPDAQEMRAAFEEAFRVMVTDLDRALDQGASVIVSFQPVAYLDTKYREASSDPRQAAQLERVGMPFYTPSTVEEFYSWDPAAIRPSLTEDRIAGVEAAIWCEFVETFDDLLFLLLPRLPGVLEKGWAAAGSGWDEYAPRLAAQSPLWERHGWQYYRSSVVWSDPV